MGYSGPSGPIWALWAILDPLGHSWPFGPLNTFWQKEKQSVKIQLSSANILSGGRAYCQNYSAKILFWVAGGHIAKMVMYKTVASSPSTVAWDFSPLLLETSGGRLGCPSDGLQSRCCPKIFFFYKIQISGIYNHDHLQHHYQHDSLSDKPPVHHVTLIIL